MNEFEALELIAIYTANAHTLLTLYISFTFAYFATAHFVGANLSKFEVFAVSGLYVTSATLAQLGLVANVQVWREVAAKTVTVMDVLPLYKAEFWIIALSTIMIGGIFISLYYMWHIRHLKPE